MKNLIYVFAGVLFFFFSNTSLGETIKNPSSEEGNLTLLSSPDLKNLSAKWANAYTLQHPKITISVSDYSQEALTQQSTDKVSLALVSKPYVQTNEWENIWHVVVARKVIVPIINQNNPVYALLIEKGLSVQQITQLIKTNEKVDWGKLMGLQKADVINFYTFNDEAINAKVAGFLNLGSLEFNGTKVNDATNLIQSIQNDKNGIGFCYLADLVQPNTTDLPDGLALLPIDKDSSGKLESYEKFYANTSSFSRGVWVGKYPQTLITNVYAVALEQPVAQSAKNFYNWLLTDGQTQLQTLGYTELVNAEIAYKMDKVTDEVVLTEVSIERFSGFKIFVILLIALFIVGLLFDILVFNRYRKTEKIQLKTELAGYFNQHSKPIPAGLFFDKSHTWAFMEKSGNVRIGLDDFIPSVTGTLSGIKMKKAGEKVKKGEALVTLIQQGKQLIIKAPVSGVIKENNNHLMQNAALINTDPYQEGWIYLIEPSNWLRELSFYLMADNFKIWLKAEYLRLKDFIAIIQKPGVSMAHQVVLQDGGELRSGVLKDLGPEAWEEFQQMFINEM
jgi:glycine cleavage system H lipoate-binding protein/ABC-type phosphate transport system substrate-binding protein